MKNVSMESDGKTLTITVDLTKSQGLSASGKSEIIGTTAGNQPVPNAAGMSIGLNVYRRV